MIQHKYINDSEQQRETGNAVRNPGQDRAQREDFHIATGIRLSFCGKPPPFLPFKTATEAAHLNANVPILHIKVKEENRFCSLYMAPLLVSL